MLAKDPRDIMKIAMTLSTGVGMGCLDSGSGLLNDWKMM